MSIVLLVSFSSVAAQQQTSTVWTTGTSDPNGPWVYTFSHGDTVYIHYTVNPTGYPVAIYIEDEDYNRLYLVDSPITSGNTEWVVPGNLTPDVYYVSVYKLLLDGNGQVVGEEILASQRAISVCTITLTSLDETAFGSLALLGAALAAFGTVKYYKNKK